MLLLLLFCEKLKFKSCLWHNYQNRIWGLGAEGQGGVLINMREKLVSSRKNRLFSNDEDHDIDSPHDVLSGFNSWFSPLMLKDFGQTTSPRVSKTGLYVVSNFPEILNKKKGNDVQVSSVFYIQTFQWFILSTTSE